MTSYNPDSVLELRDVRRLFKSPAGTVHAVDGISLQVSKGEIVCVLGPNGAGKTTTVKMASTLLEPTSGEVIVAGIDAVRRPREARKHSGLVLGGDRGFYMRASAIENLRFFAELQGVTGTKREKRIGELLERVGLDQRARDRVESFSRGMKQRLHIARALLSSPSLVLLDEPSIGLDPEGARELRKLVLELRDAGRGILLTTHYLHEAEEIADDLIVIDGGVIAAQGSGADIARLAGVTAVTTFRSASIGENALEKLRRIEGVANVIAEQRRAIMFVDVIWASPKAREDELLFVLGDAIDVEAIVTRNATLEEAYLAFLQRRRLEGACGVNRLK